MWPKQFSENIVLVPDFDAYKAEFLRLFGFGIDGVDYSEDVSTLVDADFNS